MQNFAERPPEQSAKQPEHRHKDDRVVPQRRDPLTLLARAEADQLRERACDGFQGRGRHKKQAIHPVESSRGQERRELQGRVLPRRHAGRARLLHGDGSLA